MGFPLFRKVQAALEGLEEVSLKQQIIEDQQKDLLADRSSPLRKYDLNFGHSLNDEKIEKPKVYKTIGYSRFFVYLRELVLSFIVLFLSCSYSQYSLIKMYSFAF